MPALIRSETRKLISTRSALALIIGASVVAALAALSTTASGELEAIEVPLRKHPMYLVAAINLGAFALIAGMKMFTDEFRHGSIVPTLLFTPRRRSVLAAKAVLGAGFGAVLTLVAVGAMIAVAAAIANARSASPGWDSHDLLPVAGLVGAGALWGILGVAMGAIVRHQVAAVVGGVVWILVIENLGSLVLGDASRLLPGQAAWALAAAGFTDNALAPIAGGLVLAVYAAIAAAGAAVLLRRRDVTAA